MHLIGMALLLVCSSLQPGEAVTDQRVRAWLESELAIGRTHQYAPVPIEAAYTFEGTRQAGALLRGSRTAMYGGGDLWYRADAAAPNTLLEAGGLEDTRWMLFTNEDGRKSLTIIAASVPFPASFNASRFLDLLREEMSLFLHGGLPTLPSGTVVDSVAVTAPSWRAKLVSQQSAARCEVTGRWSTELNAMIIERVTVDIDSPKSAHREMRFEQHRRFGPSLVAATRAQEEADSGHRDVYVLSNLREATSTDLRSKAKVPETDAQAKILDFRKADTARASLYAESPMLTWKRESGGDSYKVAGVTPTANQPSTSSEEGRTSASGNTRLIAVALVVLAVVAIPLVLRWKAAARR